MARMSAHLPVREYPRTSNRESMDSCGIRQYPHSQIHPQPLRSQPGRAAAAAGSAAGSAAAGSAEGSEVPAAGGAVAGVQEGPEVAGEVKGLAAADLAAAARGQVAAGLAAAPGSAVAWAAHSVSVEAAVAAMDMARGLEDQAPSRLPQRPTCGLDFHSHLSLHPAQGGFVTSSIRRTPCFSGALRGKR